VTGAQVWATIFAGFGLAAALLIVAYVVLMRRVRR
jgi:hypothetical protein